MQALSHHARRSAGAPFETRSEVGVRAGRSRAAAVAACGFARGPYKAGRPSGDGAGPFHGETVYVLNGPNLNLLGTREPDLRPRDACGRGEALAARPPAPQARGRCRQSNHEGEIVDLIHEAGAKKAAGIVINAGAYTHTSIAIRDAIAAVGFRWSRSISATSSRASAFATVPTSRRSPRQPVRLRRHRLRAGDRRFGRTDRRAAQGRSRDRRAQGTRTSRGSITS